MSFVIIFNKDTLFALTKAQKAFLSAINQQSAHHFMPHYPLWAAATGCFSSATGCFSKSTSEEEEKFLEEVFENPSLIQSLTILRPEIRGDECIFPVELQTEKEKHILTVLAGKRIEKGESGEPIDLSALPFTAPPCAVFRIAKTTCPAPHTLATEQSKWVKLSKRIS